VAKRFALCPAAAWFSQPDPHVVNTHLRVTAPQRKHRRHALYGLVLRAEVDRGARQPAAALDRRRQEVPREAQLDAAAILIMTT
jgi:hypothetical protein